jgi:hypothetical protein
MMHYYKSEIDIKHIDVYPSVKLVEIPQKYLDEPDSEGWWWLLRHNELSCYEIVRNSDTLLLCKVGLYLKPINTNGKWIKAIVPEIKQGEN